MNATLTRTPEVSCHAACRVAPFAYSLLDQSETLKSLQPSQLIHLIQLHLTGCNPRKEIKRTGIDCVSVHGFHDFEMWRHVWVHVHTWKNMQTGSWFRPMAFFNYKVRLKPLNSLHTLIRIFSGCGFEMAFERTLSSFPWQSAAEQPQIYWPQLSVIHSQSHTSTPLTWQTGVISLLCLFSLPVGKQRFSWVCQLLIVRNLLTIK